MKSASPKKGKRGAHATVAAAPPPTSLTQYWPYAAALLVAVLAVFEVYWPAVNGPFVLDDTYLPYGLANYANVPLRSWLAGMRPLLMFSFWVNYQQVVNQDTFPYHLVNVILHLCNGILVFLAVRKLLTWASPEDKNTDLLAIFAAGLFLLHPLQTESVSYVASRSEALSVFWFLSAFVVFLYRPESGVSALRSLAILALFGCAVLTKEHTAILPVLLVATDCLWSPGFSLAGIRRNWRLYVPITAGGVLALGFVWHVLNRPGSAGFQLGSVTWYQYFFTECRAVWDYLGLFLLPIGQNLDPDFPISLSLLDHGSIVGLAGLVAVTAAAWFWRKRFPLAAYGWLVFLILIAPTSSFVPIKDPYAERRLYLPFIGLLLILVEFLRRWKISRNVLIACLGVVLAAEGAVTYQRNRLWASDIELWKDTAAKSPRGLRPRFQLAFAYYLAGRCAESVNEYQKASELEPPKLELLVDWALAADCAGQPENAIAELRRAAAIESTAHVYQLIGNEYGKMGRYPDALDALTTALRLDPNFWMTDYTRGNVYLQVGNKQQATDDFRHVLTIDPNNVQAREALAKIGP